jgi:hypothetical protein
VVCQGALSGGQGGRVAPGADRRRGVGEGRSVAKAWSMRPGLGVGVRMEGHPAAWSVRIVQTTVVP